MAKPGNDHLSQIRRRLRAQRERLGLSQAQVAEALGVNASYIGLVERGTRVPSVDVLFKLADVVKIAPGDLFSSTKGEDSDVVELQQLRVLMKRWPPAKRRALVAIAKTIGALGDA